MNETNETQQELNYTADDVQVLPEMMEGTIKSVEKKLGSEIFGAAANNPERKYIQAVIENEQYNVRSLFNVSYFGQGNVPDNSTLAKFLKKYENFGVGIKVTLVKNSNGFFDVLIN